MAWWSRKNLVSTKPPLLADVLWPEPSCSDNQYLQKKKWIFFFLSELTDF